MSKLALPYVLLAATGLAVWLAWHFWQRRAKPGAAWYGWCFLFCGLWTFLDALSFLLAEPAAKELARRAAWPVTILVTFSFFRFVCAYTQRARWWRALRLPIVLAIVIDLLLMATSSYHAMVWQESRWIDLGFTRLPALVPGPAFYWLHLPLTYGLIVGGVVMLFAHALGTRAFHVRRIVVLSLGMLLPVLVNVLVVSWLTNGIDLTPLALLITFFAIAWVTFRDHLLDVMPAVRRLVFEEHRDAVIILDDRFVVLDSNPAALRLLAPADRPQGLAAATLFPFWSEAQAAIESGNGKPLEVAHAGAVLELRSIRIHDERQKTIGRLVVLHDVTELSKLIRELDAYARTVAHDLKNPIAATMGYLDLLRLSETTLSEPSARAIEDAEKIGQRMATIIDQLLRRRPSE